MRKTTIDHFVPLFMLIYPPYSNKENQNIDLMLYYILSLKHLIKHSLTINPQ